jgi:hypothetical protein
VVLPSRSFHCANSVAHSSEHTVPSGRYVPDRMPERGGRRVHGRRCGHAALLVSIRITAMTSPSSWSPLLSDWTMLNPRTSRTPQIRVPSTPGPHGTSGQSCLGRLLQRRHQVMGLVTNSESLLSLVSADVDSTAYAAARIRRGLSRSMTSIWAGVQPASVSAGKTTSETQSYP